MRKLILIYSFILISILGFSQVPENLEPPTIKYISIHPLNGRVTIEWSHSPNYPDNIDNYSIWWHNYVDFLGNVHPNKWKFDAKSKEDTSFLDITNYTNLRTKQVFYTLTSKRDKPDGAEYGGWSDPHGTIFGTQHYDTCASNMDLNWTKYVGWEVGEYNIYCNTTNSNDLNEFTKIATLNGPNPDTSYIHENIFENTNYKYYIEAVKKGDNNTKSTSLIFSYFTDMPIHPGYISIDSVINNSNGKSDINIHFKIDPLSELKDYRIIATDLYSSDKTIYTFKDKDEYEYNDLSSEGVNSPVYYKISALDMCNRPVTISPLSNSISIEVENSGVTNKVKWDQYKPGSNNSIDYKLYRSTNGIFGLLYESQNPGFRETLDELEYKDNSNEFCYYVLAEEYESGSLISTSKSNTRCVFITPEVHLPNAIAPMISGEDEFKPTLSFNADYLIQIYSRWGNLIFNRENEPWNGTDSKGALVKQGTYGYFVRVTTESGEIFKYKGTVSVFY